MAQGNPKSCPPRVVAATLAALAMAVSPSWAAASETLLLDTFNDDIVGQPPNGPEIGSYLELVGSHIVVDPGNGDFELLTSDATASGGPVLSYDPVDLLDKYTVEFRVRFSDDSVPIGQNAFIQALDFLEQGVEIQWAADGMVYLSVRFFGGATTYDTTFAWQSGTDYSVSIEVDPFNHTLDFAVNASPIYEDLQLPEETGELRALTFRINEPTVGALTLDTVRIVAATVVFRDGFESGDLSAWQ